MCLTSLAILSSIFLKINSTRTCFITTGIKLVFRIYLLISVAITVILCHKDDSRSRGLDVKIDPFSESMLNILSMSVCLSTEYLKIKNPRIKCCPFSNTLPGKVLTALVQHIELGMTFKNCCYLKIAAKKRTYNYLKSLQCHYIVKSNVLVSGNI